MLTACPAGWEACSRGRARCLSYTRFNSFTPSTLQPIGPGGPQFSFRSSRSGRIFPAMASTNRDAVEELLQTYGETGGINYLAAAATLPSRLAIEAACDVLMLLTVPGLR